MKRGLRFVYLAVSILSLLYSCTKDKTSNVGCDDNVSFTTDILPIIELNCSTSGCHDASASGGYSFLNYNEISQNAGIILSAIRHDSGVSPMPIGQDKLSDSSIQKVNCWILQGKLFN